MKGYAFYQHCCLSNLYTGILYSYSKLIDGKLKKTRNCQAKHDFVFIFIFKLNLCFYMCTSMWVTSLLIIRIAQKYLSRLSMYLWEM